MRVSNASIKTHQVIAGRYRIERELGRGGSAVVYRAHDERHDRRVAVKVLHPELATQLGAQRFLREIKLTASLQHPHIVPIFDSGQTEDGLLFFVMPYVEADSLRRKLAVQGWLPIEEAVTIAREVAGALSYAHDRGLIHRDIKPENILFLGGHACLTDFGIARPMRVNGDRLTQHDVIVGTPEYMSPEQGRNHALDGRSDVYSLACVLYEMLAAVPPFQAETPVGALRQRFVDTPPPIRSYRAEVPAALEEVLSRALATSPDERYASAREFSDALARAAGLVPTPQPLREVGQRTALRLRRLWRRRRGALIAVGSALVIAVAAAGSPRVRESVRMTMTPTLDSAAYGVAMVSARGADAALAAQASATLREALAGWHDARVLDVASAPGATLDAALESARQARAANLVWAELGGAADGAARMRLALYDVRRGAPVREVTVHLGAGTAVVDSVAAGIAAILSEVEVAALAVPGLTGTHSVAAMRAYTRGHEALRRFALASAESAFTAAAESDPSFGAAHAWLAQTLVWERRRGADWPAHAERAAALRGTLRGSDTAIEGALSAMHAGAHPRACQLYGSIAVADSSSPAAWLGQGDCRALDSIVVPDPRSPSGWSFRGGVHTALAAYDRATRLDPRAYAALPLPFVRALVRTSPTSLRRGHPLGDAAVFAGFPALVDDTLAYYAWPVSQRLALDRAAAIPATLDVALQRNRDALQRHVTARLARDPRAPDVIEALANVLEERGALVDSTGTGPSALAMLDSAARLAASPVDVARLGASRVRVLIKAGRFAAARVAAESLLAARRPVSPEADEWLAGVAVAIGRAGLASRLSQPASVPEVPGQPALPVPVRQASRAVFVRSALGVCDDTLQIQLRQLDAMLESYVEPKRLATIREELLARPVSLAVPCLGASAALQVDGDHNGLIVLQRALARRDARGLRAHLDSLQRIRVALRPGDVSLDQTVQEAWLRAAIGDTAAAVRQLDLVLNALPTLGPYLVTEVGSAAAIGRAFALRAELATRLHDTATAARWSRAVRELWGDADPAVQRSVLQRPSDRER